MKNHNKTEIIINFFAGVVKMIIPNRTQTQIIWAITAIIIVALLEASSILQAIAPKGFIH